MAAKWRIIGRHRWVSGAVISESYSLADDRIRRYSATIRGWRNWKLFEGETCPEIVTIIQERVRTIRDRIDADDKNVFSEPNNFYHDKAAIAKAAK